MPVDPNDLLIFKLRNERNIKAKIKAKSLPPVKEAPAQRQEARQEAAHPTTAAAQPVTPGVSGTSSGTTGQHAEALQEGAQAESAANENLIARQLSQIYSQYSPSTGTEELAKGYEEGSAEEYEKERELLIHVAAQQEGGNANEEARKKGKNRKSAKTEKESIEAAKGLMCVNHPWRPAYAICDYCKRPFCYADLVEYNGKFYCLEDVDKVTSVSENKAAPVSYATRVSGLLFLANIAFLAYFIAPQAEFLINTIKVVGATSFIATITYSYAMSLMNLAFVVLGAIVGSLLLVGIRRSTGIGGVLGALVLIGASYEYLSSSAVYLIVVIALSFLTLGVLAYGGMSRRVAEEAEENSQTSIMWPRVETF